jgi:hypothetical protein
MMKGNLEINHIHKGHSIKISYPPANQYTGLNSVTGQYWVPLLMLCFEPSETPFPLIYMGTQCFPKRSFICYHSL